MVLCDLPHPEGLRWLADAATGALALDDATRAKLVTFEPDVGNPRTSAWLGAARVAALGRTAANDPDPAARALAARILLRADDPSIQQETLAAWRAARTVRLHEWGKLGAFAETVLTDSALAMGDRLDMLEGWLLWGWVRAEQDPVAAEATAAELRRVLAAAPPRFRGEAVRFLHDHHHVFVTTTAEQKRPVPSLVGILADLDRGRAGDPEDLTALGRRMTARMRRELTQEDAYGHVRIPRRPKPPAPPIGRAARVLAGLEQDPALLALLSDVLEPPAGDEDDDDYCEDDDDAGDEERARRFREAIPAALRAPLASRVRTAGDPELARWAAALLARRGTDEDVEILFRCGGHAAVETIDTPRQLAAALAFIEAGDAPNAEKVAVFERVRPPEEPEPWQAEAFDRWVRERVPTLDRDLREALDGGG